MQKTAYKIRISDWSSDVCSSDLVEQGIIAVGQRGQAHDAGVVDQHVNAAVSGLGGIEHARHRGGIADVGLNGQRAAAVALDSANQGFGVAGPARIVDDDGKPVARSEEHTSELQSLMRISYAVFCLKQKKYVQPTT